MPKYNFYYDESEHSRMINHRTITADNYYDNFIAAVVGWCAVDEAELAARYFGFEEKYAARKSGGELKSSTIKQSQLKSGFASLNDANISLLDDFLSLFDERTLIYFAVISKIEYIIRQLFVGYENSLFVDMDAMIYSIVKTLVLYQPKEIMAGLYENTGELIDLLKSFFTAQIERDRANKALKYQEIEQFRQILMLLDDVTDINVVSWNYDISFVGFTQYLAEKGIKSYFLTIDKEGQNGNTAKAAERVGLTAVSEEDSLGSFGIRMADMLAGIISKLLKALHSALHSDLPEEQMKKRILDKSWFSVNERQLSLYRKMHQVVVELNKAWYKAYAGNYSDDLVALIALFGFMDHFDSVEEIKRNLDMQGEYFNAYACESLAASFALMRNKLPIEPVSTGADDFYIDKWGAKCYWDVAKHPILTIPRGSCVCNVLSVGVFIGVDKRTLPIATIREGDYTKCYRLPAALADWAMTVTEFASMGENVFPSKVMFFRAGDGYYADIL